MSVQLKFKPVRTKGVLYNSHAREKDTGEKCLIGKGRCKKRSHKNGIESRRHRGRKKIFISLKRPSFVIHESFGARLLGCLTVFKE